MTHIVCCGIMIAWAIHACAVKEDKRSSEDNQNIHTQRAMVDVPQIMFDALVPGKRITAMNLRPSRESWPYVQALPLAFIIRASFRKEDRTWTDDAHLAAKHIPQLGDLVNGIAPQP